MDIILREKEIHHFLSWIELNIASLTWEGRYAHKFNKFIEYFFPKDQNLNQIIKKINYVKEISKCGPLVAWFTWIEQKLICFIFINYNLTLQELSEKVDKPANEIALILRDFFIERFPHLDQIMNEKFQIGDVTSENINLTFSMLENDYQITKALRGSVDDELMTGIEVTLFPDFDRILKILENKSANFEFDINKFKDHLKFRNQMKFFQELIFLFLVGGVIIFGLKATNKWYENYLVDKISLFEATFDWLDKTLTFA